MGLPQTWKWGSQALQTPSTFQATPRRAPLHCYRLPLQATSTPAPAPNTSPYLVRAPSKAHMEPRWYYAKKIDPAFSNRAFHLDSSLPLSPTSLATTNHPSAAPTFEQVGQLLSEA